MRPVIAALVAGSVFGLLVRLGDGHGGALGWLANISGPWLLVAFAVGVLSPARRSASLAAMALLAAVAAKYALQLAQGDIGLGRALVRAVLWGVAALIAAFVFGPAGRAAGRRRWPWLLLSAALAAEATAFLGGVLHRESAQLRYHGQRPGTIVFALELCVAAAAASMSAYPRRSTG